MQKIYIYRKQLESIKRMYELHAANGADIHTFNTFYAKVINVLELAERDLKKNGFISQERETVIKERFHNLCEYVGKLIAH